MAGLKTKAFEVEDALLELITGLDDLAGATVELGTPARRTDRHVWIDEDRTVTQTYEVSGLAEMQEQFPVNVRVFRRLAARTYAEVRDAAKADAGAIEKAITADPTLGGLCQLAAVAGLDIVGWWPDEKHRACGIELTVQCTTVVG